MSNPATGATRQVLAKQNGLASHVAKCQGTGGILNLWTRLSRQTERALLVDPHRPTHEEISLASGRHHSSQIELGQRQLVLTVSSLQRTKTWETQGDGIF